MKCKHYITKLNKGDRHFIDAEEFDNCVLCLVEAKGPMTLEEMAKYFGLTKMRMSQAVSRATKKLAKKLKRYNIDYKNILQN